MATNAVELWPTVHVTCREAENDFPGTWVDAAQPADRFRRDIERLLNFCPGEHDHRHVFTSYFDFLKCEMSRYETIERVGLVARGLKRFGKPFSAYVRHVGIAGVHAGLEEEFQRVYLGEFPDSEAAVTEVVNLLEDIEALHITNRNDEGTTYAYLNRDRVPQGPLWDVWESETVT